MPNLVLVCDDDIDILEAIKMVLVDKGYDVKTLSSGINLFDEIKKNCPSVILLDLWMPNVNGEELAKKIKNNSKTKDIPVIIISANTNVSAIVKNIKVDGFLSKPFDIVHLEQIVRSCIDKKKKS